MLRDQKLIICQESWPLSKVSDIWPCHHHNSNIRRESRCLTQQIARFVWYPVRSLTVRYSCFLFGIVLWSPRHTASEYDILIVPRCPGNFDVYHSSNFNGENIYTIVTREEDLEVGRMFLCRLHYARIGWWHAVFKRMVSERYRMIWVGALPLWIALEQSS